MAVRAVGGLGEKSLAPQFLEYVKDLKHPLATAALLALADLGEVKALPKIREGLASRNDRIVSASAPPAGKLLSLPAAKADDVQDRLANLLSHVDASHA